MHCQPRYRGCPVVSSGRFPPPPKAIDPTSTAFMAILCAAPFFFGAVHTRSILFLTGILSLLASRSLRASLSYRPLAKDLFIATSAFAAWGIIGTLDLLFNPAWTNSDPLGTVLISLGSLAVIVFSLTTPISHLRTYITVRTIAGTMVALCAIIHWMHDNGKLFWIFAPWETAISPRARWPFINPNHLGIALLVPLTLAVGGLLRTGSRAMKEHMNDRDGISRRTYVRLAVKISSLCLIVLAILGTLSRNAITIAGISLMVGIVTRIRLRSSRRDFLIYGGCAAVLTIAIIALLFATRGGDLLVDRFVRATPNTLHDVRWLLLADSLPILRQHFLLGTGWGSWGAIYEHFRSRGTADIVPEYLHNDPMQFFIENGFIGAFPLAFIIMLAIARAVRGSRQGASRTCYWLTLGSVATLAASLFDFPFRIPAILWLWIFDLGSATRFAAAQHATRTASVIPTMASKDRGALRSVDI